MAVVAISDSILTDIADAIRSKNGTSNTYKPSQMPDAIEAISGGGITPTGTIEITQNGVVDVTNYASADVDVPQGITPTGTKQISITQNGVTTEDVTNYADAEVTVNVPNSYSSTDEGKVVSNGALVAQSSDTVTENNTYDTTLINSLTVNVGGSPVVPLPSGYTKYEYLESSGTQYIDTGLYTKANQKYYIKYNLPTAQSTLSQNVFGNKSGNCNVFVQNTTGINVRFGSASYASNTFASGEDVWRDLMLSADGCFVNCAEVGYVKLIPFNTTVTEDSTIHNILFGRTTGANSRELGHIKINHFKCIEGDTVIRDMYPCMRDADSVLGFYDVINNVFYTNAGTGTFTGGAL